MIFKISNCKRRKEKGVIYKESTQDRDKREVRSSRKDANNASRSCHVSSERANQNN